MPPAASTSSLPQDPSPDGSPRLDAVALWPVVMLAAFAVMAGAVAALRFPLGPVSPFIVLAMGVPVFVGLRRVIRSPRQWWRPCLVLGVTAAVAIWLVGWDFSNRALPDTPSFAPDAWAYNAMADYIEHFPRGLSSGLNTLDQYGSAHQDDRQLSASLLATLRHTFQSLAAANYLFAIGCLGGHFLGLFFLARALLGGRGLPLVVAFLGTVTGWACHALVLGNYDNLLFLAFAPAFLGLAVRFLLSGAIPALAPGFRWSVLPPAILLTALVYGYPEGIVLLGVLSFPLWLAVLGSCLVARDRRTRLLVLAAVAGLTVLFVLPDASLFIGFLQRQLTASLGHQSQRPGENIFPGLIQARFLPSIFALGDELPLAVYGWPDLLLAVALLGLTLVGAAHIGRRHRWFPWVGVCLLVLGGWIGTMQHYDYGVYKVMFCACWWVYPSLVMGFWRLTAGPLLRAPLPRLGVAALLLVGVGALRLQHRHLRVLPPGCYNVNALLDLKAVPALLDGSPLALNLNNQLDELWAVFYLRQTPLLPVGAGAGDYLAIAQPSLARGRDGKLQLADCRFMLVSGLHPEAIWHDARCSLIPTGGVLISRISNPNNEDHVGSERVFWLGTQPMTLVIEAAADGNYELHCGRFTPGPSLPGSDSRNLEITDAGPPRTLVVDARTAAIPLQLRRGENKVEIRCLDRPTVVGLPNGDTRELLLALSDPVVTKAPTP